MPSTKLMYFILCDRYRPSLPVDRIVHLLNFPSQEECTAFLVGCDVVMDNGCSAVDCKLSQSKLSV